jgi:catechol-2,3-dioxygenase
LVRKDFYVNKIGLELVSEEKGRHVFLKAGKSMLLIFNPENTRVKGNSKFLVHGAILTPPACIHLAFEIEKQDHEDSKNMLKQNNVSIEKETGWYNKEGGKSIYFRDPADNLVEFITEANWPVKD